MATITTSTPTTTQERPEAAPKANNRNRNRGRAKNNHHTHKANNRQHKNHKNFVPASLFEGLHPHAVKAARTGASDLAWIERYEGYASMLEADAEFGPLFAQYKLSLEWVTLFAEDDPSKWVDLTSKNFRDARRAVDCVFDFHRALPRPARKPAK